MELLLNLLLILFGFALSIVAIGGDTCRKGKVPLVKRLLPRGWLSLALLGCTLIVGVAKELYSHDRASREARRSKAEQDALSRALKIERENGRKLLLFQHNLAAVEISWHLSDRDLLDLSRHLTAEQDKARASPDVQTNLEYIKKALLLSMRSNSNWLNVRQVTRGRVAREILISRPFGTRLAHYPDDQPEWRSFDAALRRLIGDRFEIEIGPGVSLVDLAHKHWPCELKIEGGVIRFSIEKPGARLGNLENATATFWGGNAAIGRLPRNVALLSRDPRVHLDQHFELEWSEVVLFRAQDEDGIEVNYRNAKAGPLPLAAVIRQDPVAGETRSP